MRTHLEFVSTAFPPEPDEDQLINPGLYRKRLAQFLSEELPRHGFAVSRVTPEDWGWRIDLENPAFSLWLGGARELLPVLHRTVASFRSAAAEEDPNHR